MAATTSLAQGRAKRQRREVSYYESLSDVGELGEDFESEIEEAPARKKTKATTATARTKPLPTKKIFPFASLPAELRNKIYGYALTDSESIFLISKTRQYRRTVSIAAPSESRNSRRRERWGRAIWSSSTPTSTETSTSLPSFAPSILALNHQIYAEALPMLYGSNSFSLEDTTALHAFCACIGPKNCAALREIRIKGWGYTKSHKAMNHPAFAMLASAVNLNRLSIECQINWSGPKHAARQLYRDGHHWFEALRFAKGQADAGVEIVDLGGENLRGMYAYERNKNQNQEEKMKEFQDELRKLLKA